MDGILKSSGITAIAQTAELNRTTLYRAFRLQRGPRLETMIKVLRVFGLELAVKERSGERTSRVAKANAVRFTAAFSSGGIGPLRRAFAESLRSQDNVSHFASKTNRSREALYRLFRGARTPKFSTLLSSLNALEPD